MRARHFLALLAAGLTGAVGVGCDGNADGTGGAGGDGGTGGSTTTTTTGTGGTTTTTGTGGTTNTGDGCDSFEDADTNPECAVEVFEPGVQITPTVAELAPIDSDNDYFKFTGTKGQALLIFTIAKTDVNSPDPFADGYPDLVFTIYDKDQKQIAMNDDPIPRDTQDSSLYTVLPADGSYYIKVEEFCQKLGAGACDPAYFDNIVEPAYGVAIVTIDAAQDGAVAEPANDTDVTIDIPINEYVENSAGTGYFAVNIQGTFKDANDVDVYSFTVPDTIPISTDPMYKGRDIVHFEVYPTGSDGNGSDVATGLVWIEDMNGDIIAQVDGTKLDAIDGYPLEAPIMFGQPYTLHVQSGGNAPAGGNNFYFLLHYRGGSNPAEAGDVDAMTNNDTLATAEMLEELQSTGGFSGSFVSGDIAAGDVDYFAVGAKPKAGDNVFATCSAQRAGSGLRGLKLTLIDGDTMTPIPGATATETADAAASLGNMGAALGTTTNVVLKLEAMQDANVKGTYYSCGVVFIPPTP